jgi:hypothetical protein
MRPLWKSRPVEAGCRSGADATRRGEPGRDRSREAGGGSGPWGGEALPVAIGQADGQRPPPRRPGQDPGGSGQSPEVTSRRSRCGERAEPPPGPRGCSDASPDLAPGPERAFGMPGTPGGPNAGQVASALEEGRTSCRRRAGRRKDGPFSPPALTIGRTGLGLMLGLIGRKVSGRAGDRRGDRGGAGRARPESRGD